MNELVSERLKSQKIDLKLPLFYKVTLPYTEAPALLALLLREGISASKLYPSYHGAAEAVREWPGHQINDWPNRSFELSGSTEMDSLEADLLNTFTRFMSRALCNDLKLKSEDDVNQYIRERLEDFAQKIQIK